MAIDSALKSLYFSLFVAKLLLCDAAEDVIL